MSDSIKKYDGDATAGFSGFLYQADIALLMALEKIEQIGGDEEKLKKWSLEVEGEEDFTLIKKDDSGKVIFREAYQVKETVGNKPSDYTIPVIKLFEESESSGEKKSFLVTEKKIEVNSNIEFFNGLYSGSGLMINQGDLKYLREKSFLKDKINFDEKRTRPYRKSTTPEKYKFNDEETKEKIEKFVGDEVKEFIKEENFGYISCGDKDKVNDDIMVTLQSIRKLFKITDKVDLNYFFRYWESKIKRLIQENKKIIERNKINEKENEKITEESEKTKWEEIQRVNIFHIKENILKDGGEILDENVVEDYYQDIFINHFIEVYNIQINEIEKGTIFNYIKEDKDINYKLFFNKFKSTISDNILLNNEKLLLFIKNISIGEKGNSYFESNDKVKSFKELINNVSNLINSRPIKNKIILLVRLFYLKYNNLSTQYDYYFSESNNEKIGFNINNNLAILTGHQTLNEDEKEDDLKNILINDIKFLFESKTNFIGIKDSYGIVNKVLDIKKNIEYGAIGEKFDKDKTYDEKDIRIFCGDCKIEHKEKMLSDDCGVSFSNCPYQRKNNN